MEENQIIKAAIKHFKQNTGLKMTEKKNVKPPTGNPDTFVEMLAKGRAYNYWVEVTNEIREVHLGRLIQKFRGGAQNWLLISQYISKINRKHLKTEGINYLDASGNCYINNDTLLLYINDQQVAPQRQSNTGKLWKPAGLRLIFTLLLNPDLINKPYRIIAAQSNLGLGTIGILLQELEKEKYFTRYNNKYQFENREALLNRWVEIYNIILKPKLLQGKFRFATLKDRKNWKNVSLKDIYWGGEPAGALLTKSLQPEKFTVYSKLSLTDVMKQLHLVPAEDGEVEMFKTFWNIEEIGTPFNHVVPPLLAFAELNSSMDSRNREIANKIKKHFNV